MSNSKYIVTGEKHPTKTRGGEAVYLVTKYGKAWAWMTNTQYLNFYHNGKITPRLQVSQLA